MLETFDSAYELAADKGDERRKCSIADDALDFVTMRGKDDVIYTRWQVRVLECETSAAIRIPY